MGLFFRKSVRVGPLRLNFSKSGIGVSTGIRGLRIGTGPRGAYVSMGAGGVYYRQSLGNGAGAMPSARPAAPTQYPDQARPSGSDPTLGPLQEIESGSVLAMTDSSAAALLQEIQHRQALARWGPWVGAAVGMMLVLLVANGAPGWLTALSVVAGCGAWWWAAANDALRRTVVVGYDMDEAAQGRFQALTESLRGLAEASGLWHIEGKAAVRDSKYHGGATSAVRPEGTSVAVGDPPILKTNIEVPSLRVGRQRLFFFPDRVLVFEGEQVGAVSYGALRVEVGTQQFIVDGSVPRDAKVVGQTYRYVNKSGGPDRRFKDNPQLPIALYETIHFQSTNGLNELLHVSRLGLGDAVRRACAQLS